MIQGKNISHFWIEIWKSQWQISRNNCSFVAFPPMKLQNVNLKPLNLQKFMRSMSSLYIAMAYGCRSLHGIRMFNRVKYLVGFLDTQAFCHVFRAVQFWKLVQKLFKIPQYYPNHWLILGPRSVIHATPSCPTRTLFKNIYKTKFKVI